jgi:hypothetical protein
MSREDRKDCRGGIPRHPSLPFAARFAIPTRIELRRLFPENVSEGSQCTIQAMKCKTRVLSGVDEIGATLHALRRKVERDG